MLLNKELEFPQDNRISGNLRILPGLHPDAIQERSEQGKMLFSQMNNRTLVAHQEAFLDLNRIAIQNPQKDPPHKPMQDIVIGIQID